MTAGVDSGNRFVTITPDDHSGWVWLAILHSICYSVCFLGFRIVVEFRQYGLDDLLLAWAYLFAIGHWAAIFVSLSHQLGKSSSITTEQQLLVAAKALLAGRILLIPSLALAKISVVTLIRQIFTVNMRKAWIACNVSVAVVTGWAVMSIIALSAGCSAAATIGLNDVYNNQRFRWCLVLIPDALTEVGILVLICWLMKPLAMKRRLKLIVSLAFAARLPVAATSLIFLSSTVKFLRASEAAWPLAIADPVVWQELLIGISVISATIPCMRSFTDRFYTGGLVYVTGLGELSEMTECKRIESSEQTEKSG